MLRLSRPADGPWDVRCSFWYTHHTSAWQQLPQIATSNKLAIQHLLQLTTIPLTRHRKLLHQPLHLLHLTLCQRHKLAIFRYPLGFAGSRDRNSALLGDPADRNLRSGAALLLGQLLDSVDKLHILLEDSRLEAREASAEVVRSKVGEGFEGGRKVAPADGTVCYHRDGDCVLVSRSS